MTVIEELLGLIADKKKKRRDVAVLYARVMRVIPLHREATWSTINRAILERWSPSGLTWIKTAAWELLG